MKEISLTQGLVTLVDDDFYDLLNKHKWYNVSGKAATHFEGSRNRVYMHQIIMGTVNSSLFVDHINRNSLDNQRHNLRVASTSQNIANSGPRINNTSGYKGVNFCKRTQKWRAEIKYLGKKYCQGRYNTKEEAALAYNKASKEFFGEFGFQNEIKTTLCKEQNSLL